MSAAADINCALRQRVDPQTGEPLFTLEQVKDIVRRAVDEKERQIRVQYDAILQQKLQGETTATHPVPPPSPLRTRAALSLEPTGTVSLAALTSPVRPALAEQYQAFAKFNEDYISRALKTKCAAAPPPKCCACSAAAHGADVLLPLAARSDLGYIS